MHRTQKMFFIEHEKDEKSEKEFRKFRAFRVQINQNTKRTK